MGLFFKKKKVEEVPEVSVEHINYCFQKDFKMAIADTFLIMGRGTVVTGVIHSGACRLDEKVVIQTGAGTIDSTITGIEAFRQRRTQVDIAYEGENVGLLLRGVKKEDVAKGDIITISNAGLYS